MADQDETLDREGAVEKLNDALRLQHRSLIEYTLVGAAMTGFQYVGIAPQLAEFARAEADDARRLAETIEALQASIEPTGREGRSEALEHRLEHIIMRKQEQVDFLERAKRT